MGPQEVALFLAQRECIPPPRFARRQRGIAVDVRAGGSTFIVENDWYTEFRARQRLADVAPGIPWNSWWLAEGNRLKIGLFKSALLVLNPLADVVYRELLSATERGGIVAVRGKRGIGKTIAAYDALLRYVRAIEGAGRRAYVVEVSHSDRRYVPAFMDEAKKLGYVPVMYLDSAGISYTCREGYGCGYSTGWSVSEIWEMAEAVAEGVAESEGAVALVVLPNDLFDVAQDALTRSGAPVRLVDADAVLEPEKYALVKSLVEAHCGCTEAEEAAREVMQQFDDMYAVAAAVAGHWLGRGAGAGEALEAARRTVAEMAADYVWDVMRERGWYTLAPALLVAGLDPERARRLLALGPAAAQEIARHTYGYVSSDFNPRLFKWLASALDSPTIRLVLREMALAAVNEAYGIGGSALLQRAWWLRDLVEQMAKTLRIATRWKAVSSIEEVAREYLAFIESRISKAHLRV